MRKRLHTKEVRFFETMEFRELQTAWYERLKTSGFNDIETRAGMIIEKVHSRTKALAFQDMDARSEYYSRALSLIHTYSFETKRQKVIWELHSQGLSLREIALKIKGTKDEVNWHVTKIRKITKIRAA